MFFVYLKNVHHVFEKNVHHVFLSHICKKCSCIQDGKTYKKLNITNKWGKRNKNPEEEKRAETGRKNERNEKTQKGGKTPRMGPADTELGSFGVPRSLRLVQRKDN